MSPLTLFFINSHKYSFSSDKKWLFSERFFLFLSIVKIINCYLRLFLRTDFCFNLFWNFCNQQVALNIINELIGIQKREPKQNRNTKKKKKHKNDQIYLYIFSVIFYKKTYLDSCLWFILFGGSHNKPTELQTLTHRIQKVSNHPTATRALMSYSQPV